MTKQEAIDLFDGKVRNLAEALGLSVQAIHQWEDEIPKLREYEIREIIAQRNAA